GLHRAAEVHRPPRELARPQRYVDALEELPEVELERPVDHDPESAALVVLRDEDHRAVEVRVRHAGHGDQEVVAQRRCQSGSHTRIVRSPGRGAKPPPCRPTPRPCYLRPALMRSSASGPGTSSAASSMLNGVSTVFRCSCRSLGSGSRYSSPVAISPRAWCSAMRARAAAGSLGSYSSSSLASRITEPSCSTTGRVVPAAWSISIRSRRGMNSILFTASLCSRT